MKKLTLLLILIAAGLTACHYFFDWGFWPGFIAGGCLVIVILEKFGRQQAIESAERIDKMITDAQKSH